MDDQQDDMPPLPPGATLIDTPPLPPGATRVDPFNPPPGWAAPAKPQPAMQQPQGSAGSRFGHGLWDTTIGGLTSTGKALWDIVTSPNPLTDIHPETRQMIQSVIQGHVDQAQKAAEAWNQGHPVEAAGHILATAVPLVGPAAAHAAERMGGSQPTFDKYGNVIQSGQAPDVEGGLGEATGLVGATLVPEAIGKLKKPPPAEPPPGAKLASAYARNPELREAVNAQDPVATQKILNQEGLGTATQGPPAAPKIQGPPPVPDKTVNLLTDALKPQGGDVDFSKQLKESLPEIKQTEAETGQPVQGGVRPLLDNIKLSKNRVWGQFEKVTEPLADTLPDITPVPQAIRDSVTKTMGIENPELVDKMNAMADRYKGQSLTLRDVQQLWREGNDELNSYYAKNSTMQRSEAAKNPDTAATDAKVRALRDVLYNHLDMNNGAAGRAIMSRYGALMDLEGHTMRHYNDALRTVPSPVRALLSPEAIVSGAVTGATTGNPLAGAGAWALSTAAKAWMTRRLSINSRIDRAISGYEGTPAAVPRPVQQLPLPFKSGIDVSAQPSAQAGLFEPRAPGAPQQWRLSMPGGIEVPASSAMHTPGQGALPFGPQVAPMPHPSVPLRLPFTGEGTEVPTSSAMPSSGQGELFAPRTAPLVPPLRPAAPTRLGPDFTSRWNHETGRWDIIPKQARGGLLRYPTRQEVLRSLTHRQSGGRTM